MAAESLDIWSLHALESLHLYLTHIIHFFYFCHVYVSILRRTRKGRTEHIFIMRSEACSLNFHSPLEFVLKDRWELSEKKKKNCEWVSVWMCVCAKRLLRKQSFRVLGNCGLKTKTLLCSRIISQITVTANYFIVNGQKVGHINQGATSKSQIKVWFTVHCDTVGRGFENMK